MAQCVYKDPVWDTHMDQLYTYFYLILFFPGLLLNTVALWVLCRHISKRSKAVIFMINLALADLLHILSLPLRIFYYWTLRWPLPRSLCLLCFYLKYLNMYASIAFLVCISVQRCVFLLRPFSVRGWSRRYDVIISMAVWAVVGVACTPFILMRSNTSSSTQENLLHLLLNTSSSQENLDHLLLNTSSSQENLDHLLLNTSSSQENLDHLLLNTSSSTQEDLHHLLLNTSSSQEQGSSAHAQGCFKDLPVRRLPLWQAVCIMTLGEAFGFLLPLVAIAYSSVRTARSLLLRHGASCSSSSSSSPHGQLPSSPRLLLRLYSSSSCASTDNGEAEKRRALRMVLACSALFLLCFAPYHLNFLLYLMVSQGMLSHRCAAASGVLRFHPVSLCMASTSCCLNPLLYYFLTKEFRQHLGRRRASSCASPASPTSPLCSPASPSFVSFVSSPASLSFRPGSLVLSGDGSSSSFVFGAAD